jgi:hypothetical protein
MKWKIRCYNYYEGSFIVHETSLYSFDLNEKWWRFSAFQECSRTWPWGSDKWYVLGRVFSITTYDPIHLALNFPVFSVWGLRKSTKLPTSNFRNLTFMSLHALVSSWYFCKFATAFNLSNSSRSFSLASLGHVGALIVVRKLQYFTSSDSTASAPYINQKDIKFVALHTIVLWLHSACGMTSAHFPFFHPRVFSWLLQILRHWLLPLHRWSGGVTPTWMQSSFQSTSRNPWTLHYRNTLRYWLWCVEGHHSGRWYFARRIS